MPSLFLVITLGLFTLLFKVASSAVKKRRYAAEAARRSCEPPPKLPNKGLFGLGRLSEASRANKEGRTPQWFIEKFNELGESVHTFRAAALDYELIVTRDPENARAIFSTRSADFEISPHRKDIWRPLLGDGIFTAQGQEWKHSRQFLRPQFSRDQVSDLELEEKHLQSLLSLDDFQTGHDGWTNQVDLAPMFLNFTLDVATDFLYGQSVNSQNTKRYMEGKQSILDPDSEFSYHLDAGKACLYTKGLLGRWNNLFPSTKLLRHCKAVHHLVDQLIAGRLSHPKNSQLEPHRFCLLDELAKTSQNPTELRNETLQILNAGRDTTGALLGWTFYFLARHEQVFRKLRETILGEFGDDFAREIKFQKLKSCAYLHNCINEVLRVAGVVPVNERVCLRDTTIPFGGGDEGKSPVYLHEGQRILIVNYAMQHRPDLWGEDVAEFRPERWEDRRVAFDFLPFGAGPRKCIGQQFALTETAYVIVRFLQRYDGIENMELRQGAPFHHYVFSNRSGTGVKVRLHKAN